MPSPPWGPELGRTVLREALWWPWSSFQHFIVGNEQSLAARISRQIYPHRTADNFLLAVNKASESRAGCTHRRGRSAVPVHGHTCSPTGTECPEPLVLLLSSSSRSLIRSHFKSRPLPSNLCPPCPLLTPLTPRRWRSPCSHPVFSVCVHQHSDTQVDTSK